jgi:hypothetical protein
MALKFTFPGNRRKWGFQGVVDALRTKTTAIISKYCVFLSCLSPREENIAEQSPCERAQQCGYPAWTLWLLPAFYALKLPHESLLSLVSVFASIHITPASTPVGETVLVFRPQERT